MCVCVCVCVCARAHVHACVRVCMKTVGVPHNVRQLHQGEDDKKGAPDISMSSCRMLLLTANSEIWLPL